MKPTKNRFYCWACDRCKMLFATKKKANNFIKFNSAEIEKQSGYRPHRSYYCIACCGWHVTSKRIGFKLKPMALLITEPFTQEKDRIILVKVVSPAATHYQPISVYPFIPPFAKAANG